MPKINGVINSIGLWILYKSFRTMQIPIFAKSSLTYFIYLLFNNNSSGRSAILLLALENC